MSVTTTHKNTGKHLAKGDGGKPGYKHTPIGLIPEDWRVDTVGNAFQICNNLRFPINEEERKKISGIYPYYGPTKIQDYINEYRVEGKFALIGEDGDHFLKWKELPMTLLVEGKFNVNNHAHLLKGEENLTEWFYYYFNHRELTPYLTRQGAGRYKLTKDALAKMPCVLPPFSEQVVITNLLTTWDKAITTTTALITKKEQRKKWLMQQLLTGKRRLKGFSGEWKEMLLKDVFEFIKSYSFSREQLTTEIIDNPIYCIHYGDIHAYYENEFLNFEKQTKIPQVFSNKIGINKSDYLQDGDVIIADASEDYQGVGEAIEVFNLGKKNAIGGLHTIVLRDNTDETSSKFRAYLFSSETVRNDLRKKATGTSVYSVTKTTLLGILLKLPPIAEQAVIATVLQAADNEIQILKQQLEQLKEQKKGLMQVLLTGKKRMKF